jgi:hypothetical protein
LAGTGTHPGTLHTGAARAVILVALLLVAVTSLVYTIVKTKGGPEKAWKEAQEEQDRAQRGPRDRADSILENTPLTELGRVPDAQMSFVLQYGDSSAAPAVFSAMRAEYRRRAQPTQRPASAASEGKTQPVSIGTPADSVLAWRGRSRGSRRVGSDEQGLLVEWSYPDVTYLMGRRVRDGIEAYRVIKITPASPNRFPAERGRQAVRHREE